MTRSLNTLFILPLIAALGLMLAAIPVAAATDDEERWYQVELIVFENKASLGGDKEATEVWTQGAGQTPPADIIELQPDNQAAMATPSTQATTGASHPYTAFKLLPKGELTLGQSIKRLNGAQNYQPLLHIGWRQLVPERNKAKPILIDSRQLMLHTARLDGVGSATEADTSATSLLDSLEQGPDEIVTDIIENFVNGTLTLSRGRYLHLNLDLLYQRQPNAPQLFSFFGFGNVDTSPEQFRLVQKRRLKRGELHYFDHPKFGILVMVTAAEDKETNKARTIPLNRRQ